MDHLGRKLILPKGSVVFRQGEQGDAAYLIERGRVAVTAEGTDGPQLITHMGGGEIFGEMAIIDGSPRSATVTAADGVELLVITRQYFEEKIAVADPILRHFLFLILQRMRGATGRSGGAELLGGDEEAVGRERVRDLLRLQHDLMQALEQDEFELHFQPIVALDSRQIAGFEALIRWRNPQRGIVSPLEFIAAAEDAGSIIPLGAWVFEQACASLARLRRGAPARPLYMSVNLSYRQFFDPDLIETISRCIEEYGLDPRSITVEVTESLFISNTAAATAFLQELKGIGMRIAVDDFGTGYASLNYLHRFPFDLLKIDQSFIATMQENPKSRAIVESLAELSHRIGMEVIAEGLDDAAAVEMVAALGCAYGQGYHFARPLPEGEAAAMLERL